MKRFLLPLLALTALAARAEAGTVESPLTMAATLEARMAAGDGVTLPDPATEIVRHAGTIDLARGDWPAAFRARAGETICVAVSPFTGNYEFFDESGERFFTLVPVLPTTENWVAPFRHAEDGTFPDDALYAPWRLVDVWSLTHAESAEYVSHAESAENAEFFGREAPSARPPRRSGAANEWLTLGVESDLAPWTARIAGHFDLRGIVPCGDFSVTTAVQQIEVQFPNYEDIIGDAIVFSSMSNAWRRTKDDCTEVPNQRHELGFWIQLDTFENEYSIGSLEVGDYVTGSTNGFLRPLSKPLDLPTICMPTDWGAVYTVGRFHTHTPRTYISPTNIFRRVGPSDRDRERHAVYGVPGIVYDYVGVPDSLNNPTNRLYNGHNKEDPARTYPVDPSRRQTPQ